MRIRTRSPSLTISGVEAGPALPLMTSQLNSMFMVFGMVLFGSTAYSCSAMQEVFIHARRIGRLRMHDEAAEHAHHFLHGHVRVIKECSVLAQSELVHEAVAGHD